MLKKEGQEKFVDTVLGSTIACYGITVLRWLIDQGDQMKTWQAEISSQDEMIQPNGKEANVPVPASKPYDPAFERALFVRPMRIGLRYLGD